MTSPCKIVDLRSQEYLTTPIISAQRVAMHQVIEKIDEEKVRAKQIPH